MPERPLTIATYAAGASLAAVTLVYVFGPTFFLDDEAANMSKSSRKKGVVGLTNPANDCFINSVLQVLAGLPELRIYLIREMHRRKLDGNAMYDDLTAALEEQQKKNNSKPVPEWKLLGLQQGLVTAGLKEVLDALNERPIYKKTISAQNFIRVVEQAFRTRISRSQQDAQEFLQVVAERLADEHYAGRKARNYVKRRRESDEETRASHDSEGEAEDAKPKPTVIQTDSTSPAKPRDSKAPSPQDTVAPRSSRIEGMPPSNVGEDEKKQEEDEDAFAFPLEGRLESQVECSHCHFKPRPHISSFVTLTLHVPQNSGSTSLNACFDGMLKQEQIDDFTCDKCRLDHALQLNAKHLSKTNLPSSERQTLEQDRSKLETALSTDPETPPKDVKLPDLATAPKRRITRHTRISRFPRILAIHLSRSVWDPHSTSQKNTAKVAFPEHLPLGGLLDRQSFRLLGAVTHKGGHNSGHYETFRRQFLNPPFSTPTSMGTEGIYSVRSSPAPSPRLSASKDSTRSSTSSSASSSSHRPPPPPNNNTVPLDAIPTPGLPSPPNNNNNYLKRQTSSLVSRGGGGRRKRAPDRWWRISDEKVKENKTGDVLGMQREVYLLFYEMVEGS